MKDHQVANTGVILKTVKAQVKQKQTWPGYINIPLKIGTNYFSFAKQVQPISTHPTSLPHVYEYARLWSNN